MRAVVCTPRRGQYLDVYTANAAAAVEALQGQCALAGGCWSCQLQRGLTRLCCELDV